MILTLFVCLDILSFRIMMVLAFTVLPHWNCNTIGTPISSYQQTHGSTFRFAVLYHC